MILTVCGYTVVGLYALCVGTVIYRAFRRERRDLYPYLLSLSPAARKRLIRQIVANF